MDEVVFVVVRRLNGENGVLDEFFLTEAEAKKAIADDLKAHSEYERSWYSTKQLHNRGRTLVCFGRIRVVAEKGEADA